MKVYYIVMEHGRPRIVMRVARSGGLPGYKRRYLRTRISRTGVGSVTKDVGGWIMYVCTV